LTSKLVKLSRRIYMELGDIQKVIDRAQTGWQEYKKSGDELYLDSVALSLHGFYNGIEGLLENIATSIDRHLPGGNSWHRELLDQMANELYETRPAVISEPTLLVLDEYLRFRHVVRNIYSYRIDAKQLEPLAEAAPSAFDQVSQELTEFARWLIQS
jgi:hypothetical protein